jgi:hypothetical protein
LILEIILERISLGVGSLLNYSKLIKNSFFMAFNLYNFGSLLVIINGSRFLFNDYSFLVQVITRLGFFQLGFSFLGLWVLGLYPPSLHHHKIPITVIGRALPLGI